MDTIEIQVKEPKLFRVDGVDYQLTFPLSVVAELEVKLGRPMKDAASWLRIRTKEIQAVLEAGFTRYHPDAAAMVAESIANGLDQEEIDTVIDGLFVAACPKAAERLRAEMEKARKRVEKGLPPLPNVQGGAVS
jgi:hypothetical protein